MNDVLGSGTTGGGEFALSKLINNSYQYQFNTFCMEVDEEFYYNEKLYVSNISKQAYGGGSNTNDGDAIDERTAYLYYNFRMGYLDDLTANQYQYNTNAGANSLQEAIWFIEGESLGQDNYLVTLANGALINNKAKVDIAYASVWVLNLTDPNLTTCDKKRQDQLMLIPVPEPATLLLLGFGLIGLAGAGRKFKK